MVDAINDAKNLMNNTYNLAKKEFNDQDFSTSQLWKIVMKTEEKTNDDYVDFYIELLQDTRFVQISNDKWKLREFVTIEEFDRLANSKYSTVEYNVEEEKNDEQIIEDLVDEEMRSEQENNDFNEDYDNEDSDDMGEDSEDSDEESDEESNE